MTGPEIYDRLIKTAGRNNGELTSFAQYLKLDKAVLRSRFDAKNMNAETLVQYATWKGIDAAKLLKWAYGPVAPLPDLKTDAPKTPPMVHEDAPEYGTPPRLDATNLSVIKAMVDSQNMQNHALMKIANAVELSAITIAHITGVPAGKIDLVIHQK